MISAVEILLLLSVASLYITQVPFNKVEESFNTQAVHDIINLLPNSLPASSNATNFNIQAYHAETNQHGVEVAHRFYLPWDHTQYPGVVPRTFLGALLVGLPVKLVKNYILGSFFTDEYAEIREEHDLTSQFILQLVSRFALLSFMVISISTLLRAIQKRYGFEYRITFLLVTISQFHYMFYASRLLPNTFAAIISNLIFAGWINRQYSKSIIYIAFCVIIFRFDTAIFFGWLIIDGIFIRRFLSMSRVLMLGIPAGLVAIAITFSVDSILWARPVWPELEGLYFNAWLNKSHEWGTQPYFWYIYSCIPRMMLTTCLPMVLTDNRITREYFIPVLAFIFTYSFLPHKELRFILFVTPLLNLCATSGLVNTRHYLDKFCLYLDHRSINRGEDSKRGPTSTSRSKNSTKRSSGTPAKPDNRISLKRKIAFVIFALSVIVFIMVPNFLACFVLTRISSLNYPGGQAALSLGVTKELLDEARTSLASAEATVDLRDLRSNAAVYVNNLAAQTGVSRFVQVDGVYYSKAPQIDANTFTKGYQLIYLLVEPKEVPEFLKNNCALSSNREKILRDGASHWRKTDDELKCKLPNQSEMYCSIVDTIDTFTSVNIGAFLRNLRQIRSVQTFYGAFDDINYIKMRAALHIIRCGIKSKFNPLL